MRNSKWWFLHVVHNCLAHPLLVVAELCSCCGLLKVRNLFYEFHDFTIPEGDIKNQVRLLK